MHDEKIHIKYYNITKSNQNKFDEQFIQKMLTF